MNNSEELQRSHLNFRGNEIRQATFEKVTSMPLTDNFIGRKVSLVDLYGQFINDYTCSSINPDIWVAGSGGSFSPVITNPQDKDVIEYDVSSGLWKNKQLIATGSQIKAVFIAGENLGGQRVVKISQGKVYYFDQSDILNAGHLLGITNQAASINENIDVILSGVINNPGWNLTQDGIYFADINGLITLTPSSSGISQRVGTALDSDNLKIEFSEQLIIN